VLRRIDERLNEESRNCRRLISMIWSCATLELLESPVRVDTAAEGVTSFFW